MAAEQVSPIPTLDCASIGLNVSEDDVSDASFKEFGDQFVAALAAHGICYVKNHGIAESELDEYMVAARNFMALPNSEKEKLKHVPGSVYGWIPNETENLHYERPPDLKEAFNYIPGTLDDAKWPDENFCQRTKDIFQDFVRLAYRLCLPLSLGLGQHRSFMAKAHKTIGVKDSAVILRTNYYPPIENQAKPDQIRFGEHHDIGTFTLLHQDDIGGLEVELPGDGFVPVPPIPETLVVLSCNLLQRWTSDAIVAARHRVVIPETEIQRRVQRQSTVFFLYPDFDCEIKPLDCSDKYKPITGAGYLQEILKGTSFGY